MVWLGYWLKDRPAQSTNNASRDTSTVSRTSRRPHISHVNISVTIQIRLGLCEIWLYFYRQTLSRRADDIFTAQRPITRSLCSAQSGDKKCKWHVYQLPKFKINVRWFVSKLKTLLLWSDTKFLGQDLGSDISDCDLLVPRSHETSFCRLFTQKKSFFFFSERFGVHEVNFNDPSRPRTPKESANVLTEIYNTRKIPDRFLD